MLLPVEEGTRRRHTDDRDKASGYLGSEKLKPDDNGQNREPNKQAR